MQNRNLWLLAGRKIQCIFYFLKVNFLNRIFSYKPLESNQGTCVGAHEEVVSESCSLDCVWHCFTMRFADRMNVVLQTSRWVDSSLVNTPQLHQTSQVQRTTPENCLEFSVRKAWELRCIFYCFFFFFLFNMVYIIISIFCFFMLPPKNLGKKVVKIQWAIPWKWRKLLKIRKMSFQKKYTKFIV